MDIRLTARGRKFTLACGSTLILGALFLDPVLLSAGVVALAWLGYQLYSLKGRVMELPEKVSFSPRRLQASFTAGEEHSAFVKVTSRAGSPVDLRFPHGGLDGGPVILGEESRVYRFNPPLAANYVSSEVEGFQRDGFGLLRARAALSFELDFRVYPRVVSAVFQALSFLYGTGVGGEQVTELKGGGYEYADSREYVAGDSPRLIDWKGTARLNRLIVKEYHVEGEGSIHIVYDPAAPDPVCADELSASFLRAVVSFAAQGWMLGLTLTGDGPPRHYPRLAPEAAVTVALRHVLETRVTEIQGYFDVLDPWYGGRIRGLVNQSLPEPGETGAGLEVGLTGPSYSCILYITSLAGDPVPLMDLGHVTAVTGTLMAVLEPCRPWRHLGLEDSYRIWEHYGKVNRSLAMIGVPVAIDLGEAQGKLAVRAVFDKQ